MKITRLLAILAALTVFAACQKGAVEKTGPATEDQKAAVMKIVGQMIGGQAPPGMAPEVKIVGEGESQLPGFNLINVSIGMGPRTQEVGFYISADAKKLIHAQAVLDVEKGLPPRPGQEPPTDLEPGSINIDGQPASGPADAPLTLIVFSDFQCPACKQYENMYNNMIKPQAGDKIRYIFLNFPLESIHPWAFAAAMASECVQKQSEEAFWKLHAGYFEKQREINAENLLDVTGTILADAGVDMGKVKSCVENKETEEAVRADMAQGEKIGLRGTPTFILNNKKLNAGITLDVINAALAEAE